jgi:hypothetical protein
MSAKSLKEYKALYLAQEPQQFEAAVVDLQLRRAREAAHAICKVVQEIEEVLSHVEGTDGQFSISRGFNA